MYTHARTHARPCAHTWTWTWTGGKAKTKTTWDDETRRKVLEAHPHFRRLPAYAALLTTSYQLHPPWSGREPASRQEAAVQMVAAATEALAFFHCHERPELGAIVQAYHTLHARSLRPSCTFM